MKVFLTGATGFIGGHVAPLLLRHGHTVLGLARNQESADALTAQGITPLVGDLQDKNILQQGARAADAVIHLGAVPGEKMIEADRNAVQTFLTALQGSGKTLLYTSGAAVPGDTGDGIGNEETPLDPRSIAAWRGETERLVLSGDGVRGVAIRPALVHGKGETGFDNFFLKAAQRDGVARYLGDGECRWSTVNVADIADLYVRALEHSPAGEAFIAASAEALSFRRMAEAASRAAGAEGKTVAWPVEEARPIVGMMAALMTTNAVVSGEKARQRLGWNPSHPTLSEEFASLS